MKKQLIFLNFVFLIFLTACTIPELPFLTKETYEITLKYNDTIIDTYTYEEGSIHNFNESHKYELDGYTFKGYYYDLEYKNSYQNSDVIQKSLTLYAWMEKNVEVIEFDVTFEVIDSMLTWNTLENVTEYKYQIGDLDFVSTHHTSIDLSNYLEALIDEKQILVYAVYNNTDYLIIDEKFQFKNLNLIYSNDFEAETNTHTTYNNNSTPRIIGTEPFSFQIYNGAVSTSNPVNGLKSVQLRHYQTTTQTPRLESLFTLENVDYMTLNALSERHYLKIYTITSTDKILIDTLTLSKELKTYEIKFHINEPFKLSFELDAQSNDYGIPVFIDDIKIYQNTDQYTLIHYPKQDEGFITDPEELLKIKQKFQNQRSKLGAPTFTNALSDEGLIEYYASLNGLNGEDFKKELQNILKNTHQRLISYDEARFVLELSDLVEENNILYLDGIYSGHKIIPYWDGGATWAREHVWPNSRLGIPRVQGSSKNQGSDVHNLRAINPNVNSSRSNRYFSDAVEGHLNHTVGKDAYYPGDNYKGDVARIIFYMATRYHDILTLIDSNIDDGNAYEKSGAKMGLLSILIQWHEEDPVSLFEINRNNIIYSYQGNRNPYIDHPEYVQQYFVS
ncbi:endonuclease [Acholeplasma equifetale]|uniref:endonuclease n=1 Tax=Acholeplasma equifetale TaxID=264634 RepID=UPI0006899522|nr:endonuclease [Acholeplasma equifetale]